MRLRPDLLFEFSVITINQRNWHFHNYNGSHWDGTYNLKNSRKVAHINNLHFLTTYAIMFKAQINNVQYVSCRKYDLTKSKIRNPNSRHIKNCSDDVHAHFKNGYYLCQSKDIKIFQYFEVHFYLCFVHLQMSFINHDGFRFSPFSTSVSYEKYLWSQFSTVDFKEFCLTLKH